MCIVEKGRRPQSCLSFLIICMSYLLSLRTIYPCERLSMIGGLGKCTEQVGPGSAEGSLCRRVRLGCIDEQRDQKSAWGNTWYTGARSNKYCVFRSTSEHNSPCANTITAPNSNECQHTHMDPQRSMAASVHSCQLPLRAPAVSILVLSGLASSTFALGARAHCHGRSQYSRTQ